MLGYKKHQNITERKRHTSLGLQSSTDKKLKELISQMHYLIKNTIFKSVVDKNQVSHAFR